MKTIYIILLLLISFVAVGQLTPANEISPWSNAKDYWHEEHAKLNNSDEYGDNRIDSSKAIFDYGDTIINSLKYIDWILEDGWGFQEGRTGWDSVNSTLSTGLRRGSVLQHGREVIIDVINKTVDTVFNGDVVRISGAQGSNAVISLGNNKYDTTAFTIVGLATQDIPPNQSGFITFFGEVRDIATDEWPAETIVWADSIDGEMTAIRPVAPNIAVVIGSVLRSHPTEGIIGVNVIPVFRLAWLSDVKAQGAQTNWDILYWNDDSLRWELNDGVIVLDSIAFGNGASIYNSETDTLIINESVTKVMGELLITGHVYEGEHASGQTYVSTSGTQTIGTGGTFERLNEGTIAYTGDHLHEFTHDDGRLTYTSPTGISMTVAATISVESGEVTQVINFRIAQNGTTIASTNMPVTFNAVNTNAAVPLFTLIDMAQNDYIEVWVTSDTNGDDVIINNLTMGITKH